MLHPNKEKAILEWLNCLSLGNVLESLEELKDGNLFLQIIQLIENSSINSDTPNENFKEISKFLDDYYQTSTHSFILYKDCTVGSISELAKVTVLLLSSVIQLHLHSSSQQFIVSLTNLNESIQEEIQECLESVLLNQNRITLGPELINILGHKKESTSGADSTDSRYMYKNSTPMPEKSRPLRRRNRLQFTDASPISPLKTLFESPLMQEKVAIREVTSLRSRLSSEQSRSSELETELHKLHEELHATTKELEETRKIITELRGYRDLVDSSSEYKVLAEQQKAEIEKLMTRIRELEIVRSINVHLETENQTLLKKNEEMENSLKSVEQLHLLNSELSQKTSAYVEELSKLKCINSEYENQILKLREELKSSLKESEVIQQMHSEKLATTQSSDSSAESISFYGECLGEVVTDVRLAELKSTVDELNNQLQKQKENEEVLISKNIEFHNSVNTLTQQMQNITYEKEEMQKEIQLLELTKDNLQKCLQTAEITTNEQRENNTKIEEENRHLKLSIGHLEKNVENLNHKIDQLISENENNLKMYVACSDELKSVTDRLNKILHSCNNWKEKYLQLEQKHKEDCQMYLSKQEMLILEINQQKSNFMKFIEEKDKVIVVINEKILERENVIKEKEAELNKETEQHTSVITNLTNDNAMISNELCQIKEMLKQSQNKFESHKKELQSVIECLTTEKENLTSLLEDSQLRYNDKMKELSENCVIIENISKEKENLKKDVEFLNNTIENNNKKLENLLSKNRELEINLEEHRHKTESMLKENEQLKSKIKSLEAQYLDVDKENKDLFKKLEKLHRNFENLEKEGEAVMQEKKMFEEKCCLLQEKLNTIMDKLNESETDKSALQELKDKVQKEYKMQLQQCEENNQNLKAVVDKLKQDISLKEQETLNNMTKLEEEMNNYKNEINRLNHLLEENDNRLKEVKNQLETNKQIHDAEINAFKAEMQEAENVFGDIKRSLDEKIKEAEKQEEETSSKYELLESDNQKILEKLEDIDRELHTCKKAKDTAEKEYFMCVEQKENDKEELKKQIFYLEEQRKIEMIQYEKNVVNLNSEIEKITNENNYINKKYENEKKNVQDITKEKEAWFQSLTEEINKLKEHNESLKIELQQNETNLNFLKQNSESTREKLKQEIEESEKLLNAEKIQKEEKEQEIIEMKKMLTNVENHFHYLWLKKDKNASKEDENMSFEQKITMFINIIVEETKRIEKEETFIPTVLINEKKQDEFAVNQIKTDLPVIVKQDQQLEIELMQKEVLEENEILKEKLNQEIENMNKLLNVHKTEKEQVELGIELKIIEQNLKKQIDYVQLIKEDKDVHILVENIKNMQMKIGEIQNIIVEKEQEKKRMEDLLKLHQLQIEKLNEDRNAYIHEAQCQTEENLFHEMNSALQNDEIQKIDQMEIENEDYQKTLSISKPSKEYVVEEELIKSYKYEISTLKETVHNLETTCDKANSDLSTLQETVNILRDQKQRLESCIINRNAQIKKLIQEKLLTKEEKETNQNLSEDRKDVHNSYKTTVDRDTTNIKENEEFIPNTNESTENVTNAELTKISNLTEEKFNKHLIYINKFVQLVRHAVLLLDDAKKQTQMNQLKEQFDLFATNFNSIQTQNEELYSKLLDFQTKRQKDYNLQIECLNVQISDILQQLNLTEEEKHKIKKANSKLTQEIQNLNDEIHSKIEEIELAKQEILEIERSSERKQKHLEEENIRLEEKLQILEVKYETIDLEKNSLQNELNSLNQKKEDLLIQVSKEEEMRKKREKLHHEELQKLKNIEQARRNEYIAEVRNEMVQLQNQVKESDMKNQEMQKSLRHEKDVLSNKYESAKKFITNLQEEKRQVEEACERLNQELGRYRTYYNERKSQLTSAQTTLEKKNQEVSSLLTKLKEAQKTLNPLQDKIKQQELLLQQEKQQKTRLTTQLELAERQIKELRLHCEKANSLHYNNPYLSHNHLSKLNDNNSNTDYDKRTSYINIQKHMPNYSVLTDIESADPNLSSSYSLDITQSSTASTPAHRQVPAGTGSQFMCEDEEGEFMNQSHLSDLKAGRCILKDSHLVRISELQRRNTLCLPHLQSSYPVETQMHSIKEFSDDALKNGSAVEDDKSLKLGDPNSKIPIKGKRPHKKIASVKRKGSDNIELNTKKQGKILDHQHPSYQKPGPPTPKQKTRISYLKSFTPRRKVQIQDENLLPTPSTSRKPIFKTPSSLKRFVKRRINRTPKQETSKAHRLNI